MVKLFCSNLLTWEHGITLKLVPRPSQVKTKSWFAPISVLKHLCDNWHILGRIIDHVINNDFEATCCRIEKLEQDPTNGSMAFQSLKMIFCEINCRTCLCDLT